MAIDVGWVIAVYLFVMLITLGHFYRAGDKIGVRQIVAVLGAPVWWIVTRGVNGTLRAMGRVVYENYLLWAVGFIAAGHYLAKADSCSNTLTCSALGAKAALLSLPPVAFVYWGYVFGGA